MQNLKRWSASIFGEGAVGATMGLAGIGIWQLTQNWYVVLGGAVGIGLGVDALFKWAFKRHFSASLICSIVMIAGGLVVLTSYGEEYRKELQAAARWEDLRKTVVIAGSPLVQRPQVSMRDYHNEAVRLVALRKAEKIQIDNPELVKQWEKIEEEADSGLETLRRIGRIDNNKPSGYEIIAELPDDNWEKPAARRVAAELEESDLKSEFRKTELALEMSIGNLQQIANAISRQETPNLIVVRYWPSWEGTLVGDTVEVQNTSDRTLENAVVFVKVQSSGGDWKVHAHYVNHWPSGEKLSAVYPYYATDYAAPETGADPNNVEVWVYLPSGTARATYTLTPEDWDRAVMSYCSRVTFSNGMYLGAFTDGSNLRQPAGFQFQFDGLPTLPVKSVEVHFTTSTGDVQAVNFTYPAGNKLSSGRPYANRNVLLDGETPSHIEYVLRFARSDYGHHVQVY
jgi:hypothetical protein